MKIIIILLILARLFDSIVPLYHRTAIWHLHYENILQCCELNMAEKWVTTLLLISFFIVVSRNGAKLWLQYARGGFESAAEITVIDFNEFRQGQVEPGQSDQLSHLKQSSLFPVMPASPLQQLSVNFLPVDVLTSRWLCKSMASEEGCDDWQAMVWTSQIA